MNLVENVVKGGGRLLWVEGYGESRHSVSDLVSALILTFDVSRILVFPNSVTDDVEFELIKDAMNGSRNWVPMNEKEPWWRVIGSPLVRVEKSLKPKGYRLQFRELNRNPRYIRMTSKGSFLQLHMEVPC